MSTIRQKILLCTQYSTGKRLKTRTLNAGDPDRIRTYNLPLRRGPLYPVEPRGREETINKTGFSDNSNRLTDFDIIGATYLVRLEMFNLIALQLSLIQYRL